MKKLLFILSALLVSVITYGASLNPYAYNLSSTWNEATQELTVRFKLNAHPKWVAVIVERVFKFLL